MDSARKVHLDTDFGGDIDDLAALALLLSWPGVEITGITTVAEDRGRRAGYVHHALRLAGRSDIPVAAGVDVASGMFREHPGYPPEDAFWPEPVSATPGDLDAALELLKASIERGAMVVGIGPWTNLALFDRKYPGLLQSTALYLTGGYIVPPRPKRSTWGNDLDYNVQMDVVSALHVLTHCTPTLVPLHVTVETSLRFSHLPVLEEAEPLARLIAHQARAFDRTGELTNIDRRRCTDLPGDFVNHLYDPLTCAVAAGWEGVTIETLPLRCTVSEGLLHEEPADDGVPTQVVTQVDGPSFDDLWLATVTSRATKRSTGA